MEEKQIDIIVRKLYAIADLAHITHANIRVGFHHEATGEFYASVIDLKDRIVEHLMGSGKLIRVNANILEIGEDLIKEASNFQYMLDTYASQSGCNALINMSGDYIEALSKLKLKFMMS